MSNIFVPFFYDEGFKSNYEYATSKIEEEKKWLTLFSVAMKILSGSTSNKAGTRVKQELMPRFFTHYLKRERHL